jgi:hypothetical protein
LHAGASELQIDGASISSRSPEGRLVPTRFANSDPFRLRSFALGGALTAAPIVLALTLPAPEARATPQFARQTGRSCNVCHRGVPRLNDKGLAFKHNGFRFPDSDKPSAQDHKDTPRP